MGNWLVLGARNGLEWLNNSKLVTVTVAVVVPGGLLYVLYKLYAANVKSK